MIVVEYRQIELDYCPGCEGVWFDSDELELLIQSAGLDSSELGMKEILTLPEVKSSRKERKCPICNRRMKEIAIGEPVIYIDVCRRGDGIWFDGGEVNQLLGQLVQRQSVKEGTQRQIVTYLGEVFKARD
jgi:Zn-finger nucleic acid-binding protein